MTQLRSLEKGTFIVPVPWEDVSGQAVSEAGFIEQLSGLPLRQVLPVLIRILQYGDAGEPSRFEKLDSRICRLFPTKTARLVQDKLSQGSPFVFFSQWQLIFGIKLLCTFGSRDAGDTQVTEDHILRLLLTTNGFYPLGGSDDDAEEDIERDVQRTILRGYSLMQSEKLQNLIGRYAELFGRLTEPTDLIKFKTYVDIRDVLTSKLDVQLDVFKAVMFGLYSNSVSGSSPANDGEVIPRLGSLIPEQFSSETKFPQAELDQVLDMVTTSPDEIRKKHISEYGDRIGNPVDLGILLRNPVIKLADGSLAGVSGRLLIQRYTSGLYWDIHDVLPDDSTKRPNRRQFQSFFGELHEQYGRNTLLRIESNQLERRRKIRFLPEEDDWSRGGSNPDGLLIESIGSTNTRCTLLEFKVGRPRYKASIVAGDVLAFEKDLRLKIEEGLDQEIEFCRQLLSGKPSIPDLLERDVRKWFFVIVVTDPFPSWGTFLEPLRTKLADFQDLGSACRYGPFVLSLYELEQLETLPNSRVSQLLIDWYEGLYRDRPFNTFYATRTKGRQIANRHVAELANDDLDRVKNLYRSPNSSC